MGEPVYKILFPQESLHSLASERTGDRLPQVIKTFIERRVPIMLISRKTRLKILLMATAHSSFQPLNEIIGLILIRYPTS
jgi:hypothetical protein